MRALGQTVTRNLEYTVEIILMVYLSVRATISDQAQGIRTIFGVVSAQIYFTGFQALPLTSMLALGCGGVVILQGATNLGLLGGGEMIGKLFIMLVVRELAPLMTALVVIARSGTAVASEVGNMRANREIEALEVMGINPLSFIVFPRLIGGVISLVCLAIYFVAVSLIGGFLLTKLVQDMSFHFYVDSISQAVDTQDLWLFLLKNVVGGVMIFVVCCYQGMSVGRSPTEVPVATTQAVVKSILYIIVFNMSVSVLFYLNQLAARGVL